MVESQGAPVVFKFKPDATPAQIDQVTARCCARGQDPGASCLRAGCVNNSPEKKTWFTTRFSYVQDAKARVVPSESRAQEFGGLLGSLGVMEDSS